MYQLQAEMGDLWVEAFYRDWVADHQGKGLSTRLEDNRMLRNKLLRDSCLVSEHRMATHAFIQYGYLFLTLLKPPHNRITIPLEAFAATSPEIEKILKEEHEHVI